MQKQMHDLPLQRTAEGLEYERFINEARRVLKGMSSEDREKVKRLNVEFLRGLSDPRHHAGHAADLQKAVTATSVHVDTLLATMSVKYKNDEYIGERLMPVVPVAQRSNLFAVFPKREAFNYPDDEITGHRVGANEISATRTTDNYSVRDYGFKNFLDLMTVQNQDAPFNEMVDLVEAINEGIAFKREARILAIAFASGSYGSNTAGASTVWSDASGGSIIADIAAADSALFQGFSPTEKLGFCAITVWNGGIFNNAALAERFKYTAGGMPTTKQVASMFGLDDILVSRARIETANIGQTASYARMNTVKAFGIVRAAKNPTVNSLHFGSTFRLQGDPFTTQWNDPSVGSRGGIYARVTTSEDHKIVSADAGYLITAAVA